MKLKSERLNPSEEQLSDEQKAALVKQDQKNLRMHPERSWNYTTEYSLTGEEVKLTPKKAFARQLIIDRIEKRNKKEWERMTRESDARQSAYANDPHKALDARLHNQRELNKQKAQLGYTPRLVGAPARVEEESSSLSYKNK